VFVALTVLALFEMPAFDPYRHDSSQWWPIWGVLIALALLARRSQPLGTLAVTLCAAAAASLTRSGPNWGALSQATIFVGPAVALANIGATVGRTISNRLAAATAAGIIAVTLVTNSAPDTLAAQIVIVGGAWTAGEAFRARRHEIILLREVMDNRAEEAADVERNRIARELHDVIAHQLAVISIQAGAARLIAQPASSVLDALTVIEDASQRALSDIRRVLGVLRDNQRTGDTAPQPDLDALDRLAGRLRDAGIPIETSIHGDTQGIPPGLSVTAYRIVQEALTNVAKHAGPVATMIRVTRTLDALELDIRNDPPLNATVGGTDGRGLLGMRERVAACQGTLHTGREPDGGYLVSAHLPLQ